MTPTPRAAEDRALWEEFRHHSRTFSLAARFLPRPVRMPVATLYLFCRTVDTIADERVLEVGAAQALEDIRDVEAKLACTLAGRPPEGRLWRRLGEVHDAFELAPEPLYELTRGAAWDLEGRPIKGRRDLIDYSNLVGGSVGAMMLPFLAERRADWPSLEAPARALGIAMQITNILRDVGEDVPPARAGLRAGDRAGGVGADAGRPRRRTSAQGLRRAHGGADGGRRGALR